MDLEDMTYLVIALSIATLGFVGYIHDIKAIDPSIAPDTSFNNTYNKIDEEAARVLQAQNTTMSGGVNSAFGLLPTVQTLFSVGTIMLSSIDVVKEIFRAISTQMGIPVWAVTSFVAVLTIGFVWAIIRATMGRYRL